MRCAAVLAVGVIVAGIQLAGGCFPYRLPDDCEFLLTCDLDGGTPAGCVPSENAQPADDTCGVFVSASGDDASTGTKGAPVRTLAAALAAAERSGSHRVYACAETFDENVEVAASATIFGGLDCANGWAYAGTTKKTTLTAAEGTIPLVMRGGDEKASVRVEDVAVTARGIGALDEAKRGMSSIAAVAENVSVELARCVLEAGDGAPGADGARDEMSAPAGGDGNSGGEACSAVAVLGGLSVKNDCGTPNDPSDDSRGGSGGIGEEDGGGPGAKGSPGTTQNGGQGEEAMMACTDGTPGDNGTAGEPGAGASGRGEISSAGYTGSAGSEGTKGTTAQGGGGGGGSKGGTGATKCELAASAGGASGGSGGAGGCGGKGGKGGGAGGASIALLSLNAQLHFDGVSLKTAHGGAGGKGSEGQSGGSGGDGGPGGPLPARATVLYAGCTGGVGGTGGQGGRGGGGLGGPSIGIAFRDVAPVLQGATITTGDAGPGGLGADPAHSGAAGVKADMQEF